MKICKTFESLEKIIKTDFMLKIAILLGGYLPVCIFS